MTAYLMTAEQHAQIVDALALAEEAIHDSYERDNMRGGYQDATHQAIHATARDMLKAMKPVEPVAWTLTEELTKRETTTRAHLWFSNPVNCLWTPLYALGDTA